MVKSFSKYNSYLFPIVIVIFSFLIYYNSLKNDFVFDDESVIINNTSIQSLSNIPKYFTGEEGFHKVIGRYYRPIVSATYNIDYAINGLKPYGYHLTNIFINIFCCFFLYLLIKEIFHKVQGIEWISFLCTLIFASHPVHTEAVSWVSGRTDSLVTLFFILSFLMFAKFRNTEDNKNKTGNNIYFYFSLIFYFLGLLSKEMIITFPLIVILYDFLFNKKEWSVIKKKYLKDYVYLILITIFYLLLRYITLKDVPEREKYFYFYGKTFITAFSTMLKTIPEYFKLLLYPVNLIYHYNGYLPDSNSVADISVILSIAFIAVLIFLSFILIKRNNIISFCILFFLVSLLPVMNIIPSMNFMAERFLYLPSISLIVFIAYLFVKFKNLKTYLIYATLLLIGIFSYLTYERNKEWKDNNTLYKTGEGIDGTVLLVNCGNIYANNKQFDEAEIRYRKALGIRENNVLANHNLGLVFLIKGQTDSAKYFIMKGISIDSLAPDGYFQMANIYQTQRNIDSAKYFLEKLQIVSPNYRESAGILESMKNQSAIIPENVIPDKVITLNQNTISHLDSLSFQNYSNKNFEEAIKNLKELIKINPQGEAGYLNNMSLCYVELNQFKKAEECLIRASELDKSNMALKNALADLYLKMNDVKKAVKQFQEVLDEDKNNNYAKYKLDSLTK